MPCHINWWVERRGSTGEDGAAGDSLGKAAQPTLRVPYPLLPLITWLPGYLITFLSQNTCANYQYRLYSNCLVSFAALSVSSMKINSCAPSWLGDFVVIFSSFGESRINDSSAVNIIRSYSIFRGTNPKRYRPPLS